MKACYLTHWCFGLILIPCLTFGQNDYHPAAYTYNDHGNSISSNVPLNEINAHAWRHFHRLFPTVSGQESWFFSDQGYQVSFELKGVHYEAYFDHRGAFRYSLHHYAGTAIPREPGDLVKRKFPDYL